MATVFFVYFSNSYLDEGHGEARQKAIRGRPVGEKGNEREREAVWGQYVRGEAQARDLGSDSDPDLQVLRASHKSGRWNGAGRGKERRGRGNGRRERG